MSINHPITPPPELVQQWLSEHFGYELSLHESSAMVTYADIATQAARWGADTELEACIKLLSGLGGDGEMIRRCRRPKPPTLKQQAFDSFDFIGKAHALAGPDWAIIRRALEALPDA